VFFSPLFDQGLVVCTFVVQFRFGYGFPMIASVISKHETMEGIDNKLIQVSNGAISIQETEMNDHIERISIEWFFHEIKIKYNKISFSNL
jgi:uncharacterized membrane protein YdfJ with MMPL/SSD domain